MRKENYTRIVIQFLLKKKATALLLIGCGLISNGLAIFLSLSIGTYYETLSHHHSPKSSILHFLHISIPQKPVYFFVLFFVLIFYAFFFQFLFRYGSKKMALYFSLSMRKRLFRHHIRMKTADFSKKSIGAYLLRYSGDIKSIQTYVEKGVFQFLSDALFAGLSILVLFRLNPDAGLFVVPGFALGFVLMRCISVKIKSLERNRRDMLSSQLSYVHESFRAMETIKTWNKEYLTINRFKKKTDRLASLSARSYFWKSLNYELPVFILFTTLLIVFVTHTYGDPDIRKNASSFIPFILLLLLLFPAVKKLMRVSAIWKSGGIALEKITKAVEVPLEDETVLKAYQPVASKIEFKNIFFSYSNGGNVLQNVSFVWERGEINYLEGKGKTTIAKLLLGMYEPASGTIFLDGVDAREYSKKSIREHIAFLAEDTPLHENTIYKCLDLRKDKQSYEEVQACLRKLRFSLSEDCDEIDLNKNIGHGGRLLSRSDYKKLLIARTILSKKKIWVIDELLDDVEEKVQQELFLFFEQAKYDQTIIIDSKYKPVFGKTAHLSFQGKYLNN